ncbi:MAG: type II toxin-antitoxin system RelE/ParE family toxin [Planctomycetota bacterium]
MKLNWTVKSLDDIDLYEAFICLDDPDAAEEWSDLIRTKIQRATLFPNSGRVVPEFNREDIREIIVQSHRIIYLVRDKKVLILRVWHGAMLLAETDVEVDGDQ